MDKKNNEIIALMNRYKVRILNFNLLSKDELKAVYKDGANILTIYEGGNISIKILILSNLGEDLIESIRDAVKVDLIRKTDDVYMVNDNNYNHPILNMKITTLN